MVSCKRERVRWRASPEVVSLVMFRVCVFLNHACRFHFGSRSLWHRSLLRPPSPRSLLPSHVESPILYRSAGAPRANPRIQLLWSGSVAVFQSSVLRTHGFTGFPRNVAVTRAIARVLLLDWGSSEPQRSGFVVRWCMLPASCLPCFILPRSCERVVSVVRRPSFGQVCALPFLSLIVTSETSRSYQLLREGSDYRGMGTARRMVGILL